MKHACLFLVTASIVPAAFGQDTLFERLDRDGNGYITVEELPPAIRGNFSRVDSDKDGRISPDENRQFRNRNQQAGGRRAAGIDPAAVTIQPDIEYVSNGHERHRLDLYVPKAGSKDRPLVVFVHGGGWAKGNKSAQNLAPLLNAGFACAAINYRLSSHAIFPAQIHDCKAAIRWLRSNADKNGYDGDRIGVWGSSAGGHLVALLGTSGDVESLEGDLGKRRVSSRVQAVCDYFGPTDLLMMDEQTDGKGPIRHNAANSPEALLLGGPIMEQQELAKQANPITYVSADDPPFLIVHGDKDPLVPLGQSQLLQAALKQDGVKNKLRVVPGGGHGGFTDPTIGVEVIAFFRTALEFPASE